MGVGTSRSRGGRSFPISGKRTRDRGRVGPADPRHLLQLRSTSVPNPNVRLPKSALRTSGDAAGVPSGGRGAPGNFRPDRAVRRGNSPGRRRRVGSERVGRRRECARSGPRRVFVLSPRILRHVTRCIKNPNWETPEIPAGPEPGRRSAGAVQSAAAETRTTVPRNFFPPAGERSARLSHRTFSTRPLVGPAGSGGGSGPLGNPTPRRPTPAGHARHPLQVFGPRRR